MDVEEGRWMAREASGEERNGCRGRRRKDVPFNLFSLEGCQSEATAGVVADIRL